MNRRPPKGGVRFFCWGENMKKKMICWVLMLAMMLGASVTMASASTDNIWVHIELWNAAQDKPSMGNIAWNKNRYAIYNPVRNTLQIATNPVDVSGYISAITDVQYDFDCNGNYKPANIISTSTIDTGTKNDGKNHNIKYITAFEIELPSYIKKSGIEYIPFKMKVPHTPMDVVVKKGFLDSRIRINWDQVKSGAPKEIEPDLTISKGDVEDIEITDLATGIYFSADTFKVSSRAILKIDRINDQKRIREVSEITKETDIDLYDVQLILDGSTFISKGTLELRFPYIGDDLNIYRIADGRKTLLKGLSAKNGYTVLTRKLGTFAVCNGKKVISKPPMDIPFKDISNHWAKTFIARAYQHKLFSGVSDTTFAPQKQMTNAMALTVLYRVAGSPQPKEIYRAANIPANAWYQAPLSWAMEHRLIGDYGTLPYQPDQYISRESLATLLYRYYKGLSKPINTSDIRSFKDYQDISPWAKEAFSWAHRAKIIGGKTSKTLAPKDNATRAEVATMFCKLLDQLAK